MPRMMELEPKPSYRGIVFRIYGLVANNYYSGKPTSIYTASDGTVYQYHTAQVHGPFATRGRAKAAITTYSSNRDENGKLYDRNLAEQYTIIEETSSVWTVRE
jgi:predicted heme/steroid binding protein